MGLASRSSSDGGAGAGGRFPDAPPHGKTIPVRKAKPPSPWSCAVCQVRTTSERNLREHRGGQKHQLNLAELELRANKAMADRKAKMTARFSPRWSCNICQVSCTGEWDLDVHLKGRRHHASTRALLKQCEDMERNSESQEAELQPRSRVSQQHAGKNRRKRRRHGSAGFAKLVPRSTCESDLQNHLKGKKRKNTRRRITDEQTTLHFCEVCNVRHHANTQALLRQCEDIEGNARKTTAAAWICKVCQARCNCESDLQSHLKGKKHQKQVMALQETAKPEKNKPGNNGKNTKQKQPSGWGCSTCQAKCNSESQFGDHCRGRKHKNTVQSLQKGGEDAKAASDLKSKSSAEHSEKMDEQTTLYFCEVCNVKCTSEKMLAGHLSGKKHSKNAAMQKPTRRS
ncbi:hypothetical protein GUJ93_ZPchr0009g2172 [Zizania palustris]|uniref:Matrin-type domain-containing protein n=1 Tax=Zizania palustris TaxID=103762 RepID=A0A8J5RPG7_ZIZPA|nr:hypothetical protein GUJ93_ZPchr0009g2172 [Zizania palustris]